MGLANDLYRSTLWRGLANCFEWEQSSEGEMGEDIVDIFYMHGQHLYTMTMVCQEINVPKNDAQGEWGGWEPILTYFLIVIKYKSFFYFFS